MRRSELAHLKVGDIDSQRMIIRVVAGKGGKDRDLPLSPKRRKSGFTISSTRPRAPAILFRDDFGIFYPSTNAPPATK